MNRDVQVILGLLLDRYEHSQHYRRPGQAARSVFIRYDRKTLPDYWDERHWERRAELNQATLFLESQGLVRVWRSRYSREEIERVELVLDRLPDAYRHAGRVGRREQEIEMAQVARRWAGTWPEDWRRQFVLRVAAAVENFEKLPAGLKPGEAGLLDDLCRVLAGLGPNGVRPEMPRRLFSQRVFGASKRLEEIQSRLVRLLREFWPGPLPESDREVLAELGVVENPQHVFIAGPVRLDSVDVGAVRADLGLPAAFVEHCQVTALDADWVLTVENLTSFHQVVSALPPRTLVVYLAGYHNRLRREFLIKLGRARSSSGNGQHLRFRHWGDIDLGGFRIFVHLQQQTGLPLEPLLMDVDTYRRYCATGMEFSESYGRELAALLAQAAYEPFWPVIREMLVCGRRVEQEAVEFQWDA